MLVPMVSPDRSGIESCATIVLNVVTCVQYNGELAPPGIRGSLVALQQLAITFGILISYW
jgi:hypothetical protein